MNTELESLTDDILNELSIMDAVLTTLYQANIEDIGPEHVKTLAFMLSVKTSSLSGYVKLFYNQCNKGENHAT